MTVVTVAAAREIRDWGVDEVTESLSNHRYITYNIKKNTLGENRTRVVIFPKWNTKKRDKDWFNASVAYGSWLNEQGIRELVDIGEVEKAERTLKRIVTDACDNSMSREKKDNIRKKKVYWWNTYIAELRCSM